MPSSEEMFQHFYRDGLKALALQQAQHEGKKEFPASEKQAAWAQGILHELYSERIGAVIKDLTLEKPEPEMVLQKGVRALNQLEQFRFLLENFLEAVKRDESLRNVVVRYHQLQLLEIPEQFLATEEYKTEEAQKSLFPSSWGAGRFLRNLLAKLREVGLIVMEIVTNALKVIPRLVAIKPKPSIGVSGVFPTFGLQFDLEAEAITIHELFEVLTGAGK